ncbi:uncharacterized protein LOC135714221, partial [Ochlerotatus camptorhynchus]|uniref:uncharacterized protein LOC135714221 n=1 Tax=Ochlerotatus camptorhynchus TaxID=644619 RepID=UPI0031D832D0
HHRDVDLVFDDISSPLSNKAIGEERQSHSSGSKRSTTNKNVEEDSLFDLGGFDNNNVAIADDDTEDDDSDDDDDVEEAGKEVAAPEAESQNWLVRSVHRIKRSIDNLLSGPEKSVKPAKKKKQKKNPKKPLNGSKKERSGDLNASKKSDKKSQKSEKQKSENLRKSARSEKNKRWQGDEALRPKRQFDESAYDDEDRMSGSGGMPDGLGFDHAYKLTLTVFEAYDPEFENKESNQFKQVARGVAGKLHALLSDIDFTANFVITVQELEPNPDDERETFVTFEINVDKSLSRSTIDSHLRTVIEQGYENFDLKGYGLTSEGKFR